MEALYTPTDVLNVEAYGAVGNGSTDNLAAVNAACAAANTAGGAPIYFPPGNYYISTTPTSCVGHNLHIYGASKAATTVSLGAGASLVDDPNTWYSFRLHDFTISGGANQIRSRWLGANMYTGSTFEVRNVLFYNYSVSGISTNAYDWPFWSFQDDTFWGGNSQTTIGAAIAGYGDSSHFLNCHWENNYIGFKLGYNALTGVPNTVNNWHIEGGEVINVGPGTAGVGRVTGWIVPTTFSNGYVNAGQGLTIKNVKISNEGMVATDKRIIYADQLSTPITAYSYSSGVMTFTAANSLSAGAVIRLSAPNSSDPFYPLVGASAPTLTVLSTGLSSSQFEVAETTVTSSSGGSPITAFSYSNGTMTLTASNSLVGGMFVTLTVPSADPLYALNGKSFKISSAGLSSSQFNIQETAVTTTSGTTTTTFTNTGASFNTGYFGDTLYSTSASTGMIGSHLITHNTFIGGPTPGSPMVYSYTPNVSGVVIQDNHINGTVPNYVLQYDAGVLPLTDGNWGQYNSNNVLGPQYFQDGPGSGNLCCMAASNAIGVGVYPDPLNELVLIDPTLSTGNMMSSEASFQNLYSYTLNLFTPVNATITGATDSAGGTDANTITFTASNGFVHSIETGVAVAGIPVWLEFDIAPGASSPVSSIKATIANVVGGTTYTMTRTITVPTAGWKRIRIRWVPRAATTGGIPISFTGPTTGSVIIGRINLYQSYEPLGGDQLLGQACVGSEVTTSSSCVISLNGNTGAVGASSISLPAQGANTVFAGGASGSAIPTFRTLVSADIPNNAANTTGTATNITATSNSMLATLSALSLPYSQLTGTPATPTQHITGGCQNTFPASANTIFLFGLGGNVLTCNNTNSAGGFRNYSSEAHTITSFLIQYGATGNSVSDACTLYNKHGVSGTSYAISTITMGTTAPANEPLINTGIGSSVAAGDSLYVTCLVGASDTLGWISATVAFQ
jgi:hypothetical protein